MSGPLEVNSPMAARAAAVSGLGFAILPDFIAAPEIIERTARAVSSTTASCRAAASSPSTRTAATCRRRCASSSISSPSGSSRAKRPVASTIRQRSQFRPLSD